MSAMEETVKVPKTPLLLQVLGPGLITGASDDDPSGIATYSQAGAQFGYATAWTLVVTYPLMCGIQEISGVMGRRRDELQLSRQRGSDSAKSHHALAD